MGKDIAGKGLMLNNIAKEQCFSEGDITLSHNYTMAHPNQQVNRQAILAI